jgi:O-antigen/teichoic acid export membrane protein
MTQPEPSQRSYSETTTRGATMLFSTNLAAKFLGIGTLYVTGLMLSPEDFALFAIAVAWGEIFSFVTKGGLQKILIYRGKAFRHLYGPLCGLSFIINIGLLAIVLAIAPAIGRAYESDDVVWLLIIIGVSVPAQTIPRLLRAELAVGLRFGELSILNGYSALIRSGSIILLAVFGFGPYSLAWPFILVGVFEWIFLLRYTRIDWRPTLPKLRLFWPTARQCAWIMPGLVAMSLIGNGAYMVIGALEDKTTIGLYFFGFQLTLGVFTIVSQSLYSVFTPSLAALKNLPKQRDRAFVQSMEMSTFVMFFLGFAIAAVAEPIVGLVWSGKWDDAIPVIEIMAITATRPAVTLVVRAMLEAQGFWRTTTMLSCWDAVGIMAAAAIGAWIGGLLEITYAVGAYSVVSAIVYLLIGAKYVSVPVHRLLPTVYWPYLIGIIGLAAAWGAAAVLPAPGHAFFSAVINGTIYTISFSLAAIILQRQLCLNAMRAIRNMVQRRR